MIAVQDRIFPLSPGGSTLYNLLCLTAFHSCSFQYSIYVSCQLYDTSFILASWHRAVCRRVILGRDRQRQRNSSERLDMSSPKLSAPEPHRLFSFEYVPDATHHALTDVTPPSEARHTRLQLDLRLVNCVHGKLSHAAEDFASLLIFSLESRTDIGGSKSFQVLGINLEFDREIPRKDDSIEVLKTGEDESLGADVYLNKRGVSWSNGTPKNTIRFGVLIRRNFNDLFIGTFKLTLADKQLRHLESRDDAESVLFDPSAEPIGGLVDTNNLQAASIQILWSLGAPPQIDGVEPTKKALSSATGNEQIGKAFTDQSNTPSISNGSTVPSSKTGKAKNLMMYHHKQRQVYEPQDSKAGSSRGLSGQDLEMQPLRSGDIDEQVWSDPIRFITSHEVGFKMFGMHFTATGTRCIRSIKMKLTSTNDAGEIEEYETAGHWSIFGMMVHKKKVDNGTEAKDQDRYLVVGRMSTNGFLITEKMLQYKQNEEEHILRKLHRFIRSIRGARGMLFSLKGVSGFGLYQVSARTLLRYCC